MVFSKLCSSFEQYWKLHKLLCLGIGNYSECTALDAAGALTPSPSGTWNCAWDTCNKLQSVLKLLSEKCLTVGLAKCMITAQLCRKGFTHLSLHRDGAVLHPLLHGSTGARLPVYVNKGSCCADLLNKNRIKSLEWYVYLWHFTLTSTAVSFLAPPQLASHLFPTMVCPILCQCQKPSASSPVWFCPSCLVVFHCCLISEQNFLLNWYA